jgi:ATP-dependent DNA helicase RecQ
VEKNMKTKEALKKYFGYDTFRLGQEELINSILNGKNVLGIMPTGSGKSICYQLPGIIFDGLTIVISPLISLMKDQVNLLKTNGIDSAYINSSLSYEEYNSTMNGIENGKYKIIYVAPERLESSDFLDIVHENNINLVAVDEAHCVSQWGHDFRPSYLEIQDFISKIKGKPVIAAFTATATKNVKNDIIKQIGLKKPKIVRTGYDRENLYFEVRKPKDKFQELLKILDSEGENSGIIYCTTRKSVEQICNKLVNKGYSATRYHGGLSDNERHNNQEKFILDENPIMVATNAFGMGIDKSNVNFVVHYNMPKNLENYYQEAGRAGRDGSPANCILLYSYQDLVINKFLIEKTVESENFKDNALKKKQTNKKYDLLNKIQGYCTTRGCYRKYILNYFGDSANEYCGNCYNCNGDFEVLDVQNESFHIISIIKSLKKDKKRFGKSMLIDILKGSNTKKIRDLSLNQFPSFGQLNDKSKEKIGLIINFLIDEKYIRVSGDKYPVIKLWKNYGKILDASKPLKMKILKSEVSTSKEKANVNQIKSESPQHSTSDIPINKHSTKDFSHSNDYSKHDKKSDSKSDFKDINNNLFEKLRKLRLSIARDEKVPPFMIFHDSTLKDMCKNLPTSKKEFLNVSGVGKVKFEKYGEMFISTIKNNLSDVNRNEKSNVDRNEKIAKRNSYSTKSKKESENSYINSNLFNKLKELRLKISKDEGVPAYIIFHDSTLKEMCKILPTSKAEFLEVPGVGKVKLEKYGNQFINIIKENRLNDNNTNNNFNNNNFNNNINNTKSNVSSKFSNKRNFDLELFKKLKIIRLDISREEKIPPFTIFSDSTLREMSIVHPSSEHEFLKIAGVSNIKMKKYGQIFLNAIKNN